MVEITEMCIWIHSSFIYTILVYMESENNANLVNNIVQSNVIKFIIIIAIARSFCKTLHGIEKDEVQAAIFLLKGSFSSSCVDNAYNISNEFPISYAQQFVENHNLFSVQGSNTSFDTNDCLYPHSGLVS